MKTTETKIEKLRLAEYNPRKISEKDIGSLKRSLKKFGFIQAVIINKDFTGDRSDYDVWEVDRKDASKYVHPTEKPDWLVMKALKNSTKFKDNVIDLFGGSGSCLMACEKMGRNAFIMELDPRFVDVILYKWSKYTKRKPVKIS